MQQTIPFETFTVGEILEYLNSVLFSNTDINDLWIRGEISGLSKASSGHSYFSLKDSSGATLRCALFRGSARNMAITLQEGSSVIAHGRLNIYEQRGELQMIVDAVQDTGVGVLYQQFLLLKQELESQGYFDTARKRPLPVSPTVIGIVTSLNAAALRDMIRTMRLRWPLAKVIIAPALVQGNDAPHQIVRAIELLNQQPDIEVILIARGGGSLEDLSSFNARIVADAILHSRIPTIAGVGHETDFTIADFVADLRAATPTAAATLVTRDIAEVRKQVNEEVAELSFTMINRMQDARQHISEQVRRLEREHPQRVIDRTRQELDDWQKKLAITMTHRLNIDREHVNGISLQLAALSPLHTIARGYSIVTRKNDGHVLRSIADVNLASEVVIHVPDGSLDAIITNSTPSALSPGQRQ